MLRDILDKLLLKIEIHFISTDKLVVVGIASVWCLICVCEDWNFFIKSHFEMFKVSGKLKWKMWSRMNWSLAHFTCNFNGIYILNFTLSLRILFLMFYKHNASKNLVDKSTFSQKNELKIFISLALNLKIKVAWKPR